MPIPAAIDADELKALLALREAHEALVQERDTLRNALRLVMAERDLAEERLRAYRRELFGAKSEARDAGQLGATRTQTKSPRTQTTCSVWRSTQTVILSY